MSKKILIIGVLISIALGIWCSNYLTYNFNIDPLAFGNNAQKEQFSKYKNAFKTEKDALIIGIQKKTLFKTYDDFLTLNKLTSDINNLSGVANVVSIENLKFPIKKGYLLSQPPFLSLTSKNTFQKNYNNLDKFTDITEKFLSKDRTSASFYVYLNNQNSTETIASIHHLLDNISFVEYHILGAPVFKSEGNEVLAKETLLITLLGIFLLLGSMIILTPSLKRILITILFTVFNVCVTLIFMYVFNFEITSFTTIIPSVIAILSFTDITHILHHYEYLVKEKTPKSALKKKLFRKIGFPLILTSVSNLFGFIIFFFNGGVHQITDLAIVATFGIIFAYISSRFLLPFLLDYKVQLVLKQHVFIENFIARCINFTSIYYKKIVLVFTVLLLVLLIQAFKNSKINMHYYEKNNTELAINSACAFYDDKFQGIRDIEVVLKAKKGTILSPLTIKNIDTIENYLLTKYGCKTTNSLNTIIKRYERFKLEGNYKAFRIPNHISNFLLKDLIKHEDKLGLLSIVSKDKTTTRIIGSLPDIGTHNALLKNKELVQFLSKYQTEKVQLYLNGKAFLFDQNTYSLTRYVLIALLFGILITGLITTFLFKSVWIGFTTFIANLLPILFGIVMITFLGLDLNPNSIFILTILFGVALDDSIYLLGHLYKSDPKKVFTKTILLQSLKTNSSPLLITSMVLSVLFLALTISSYQSLFNFGIIISTSLIFAFISDLFLIPSLLLLKKYTAK
ncbi:efflux RND transporter permease subunit [Polaribacter sp.]|uniref:efflux RND transporter permease subunit n=1 Tax=Polaribacter sp. TaxID=1920175 RepID=UPI003EF33414